MVDSTKERIIRAAKEILRKDGIDNLSIELVATYAGMSRKTIYNHFLGRFALIDEVYDSLVSEAMETLEGIANNTTMPFIEKLNAIIEYGYSALNSCYRSMITKNGIPNSNYEGYKIAFTVNFYRFIEGIVNDALKEGLIKPEYKSRELTFSLVNIVGGLSILPGMEEEKFSKVDILRVSLKAIVSGILTEKGLSAMRNSPILR